MEPNHPPERFFYLIFQLVMYETHAFQYMLKRTTGITVYETPRGGPKSLNQKIRVIHILLSVG